MTRPGLVRLCAAAFLADMALYLTLTGAPYLALERGAGPLVLGALPMARALPYMLTTVWAGKRSEGGERLRWARWGLPAALAAVIWLAATPSLAAVFAALAVIGLGLAFFWPAVQARLGDAADGARLARHLGWFNVAWSSGKSVGFLIGGWLLATRGFGPLFVAAALALALVGVVVWTFRRSRSQAVASPPAADPAVDPETLARLRRVAWWGNAYAFGVAAVLNIQYPAWLEAQGRSETLFGGYLGLVFAFQTLTFIGLMRFPGWRYRVGPLLAAEVPMIAVLVILPALRAPWAVLATAPCIGVGLGITYFASLFYSVQDPAARGRHAGMHEALLGLGAVVVPLLGGVAAWAGGGLRAPFLTAAGLGILLLGLQFRWRPPRRWEQGAPLSGTRD